MKIATTPIVSIIIQIFRKSQFKGAWLVAGSPGVPLLGEQRREPGIF